MQFGWLDLVILAVMALSVLMGLFRGFIREILSLICWVVALAVAFNFQALGASWLEAHVGSPEIRSWAGFIIIFIAALLVMSIIAMIIYRLFAATGITGTDRGLGAVFGFLRGALIIGAVVAIVLSTSLPKYEWWRNSALVGYFEPVAALIVDILPANIADELRPPPGMNSPAPDPAAPQPAGTAPAGGTTSGQTQ